MRISTKKVLPLTVGQHLIYIYMYIFILYARRTASRRRDFLERVNGKLVNAALAASNQFRGLRIAALEHARETGSGWTSFQGGAMILDPSRQNFIWDAIRPTPRRFRRFCVPPTEQKRDRRGTKGAQWNSCLAMCPKRFAMYSKLFIPLYPKYMNIRIWLQTFVHYCIYSIWA